MKPKKKNSARDAAIDAAMMRMHPEKKKMPPKGKKQC